jgi:hypothetical protein
VQQVTNLLQKLENEWDLHAVKGALCSYHGMVSRDYYDPGSVLEVVEKMLYMNFKAL